ncbi:hypothetical protein GIB67_035568 [Kingdonia uniflora]|uniref:Uncharacterized protein n=1 Tax=Kingdonia uniflora TaxID=39325 RepID=A0A7J7LCX8_9MAGN|nr:hypothetical protein GIB67_035568 [Kingdonia uniflora]
MGFQHTHPHTPPNSIPPATLCISRQDHVVIFSSPTPKPSSLSLIRLPSKTAYGFLVRSPAEATEDIVVDLEDLVETSKVPYSCISTLNVEKVLRGIAITDADHYGRLGILRGCPYD